MLKMPRERGTRLLTDAHMAAKGLFGKRPGQSFLVAKKQYRRDHKVHVGRHGGVEVGLGGQ